MSLRTIHVQTPFRLTLAGVPAADGSLASPPRVVDIPAGIQNVDPEIADHWFTKAHLSNGGLGATAYAEAQRAQADQAFVKIKEATAMWLAFERATIDAEVAAGLDPTEPACDRLQPTEEEAATMSPRALDEYREEAMTELKARRDAAKPPEPEPKPKPGDEFDAMTDEQLREFITTRDGKAPRSNTGRPKLLLAARGNQETKDEIENGNGDTA